MRRPDRDAESDEGFTEVDPKTICTFHGPLPSIVITQESFQGSILGSLLSKYASLISMSSPIPIAACFRML